MLVTRADINGDLSRDELLALRDGRLKWSGTDPGDAEIMALWKYALDMIREDDYAEGVQITAGEVDSSYRWTVNDWG